MAYFNPYITKQYNLLYNPTNQGFDYCSIVLPFVCWFQVSFFSLIGNRQSSFQICGHKRGYRIKIRPSYIGIIVSQL